MTMSLMVYVTPGAEVAGLLQFCGDAAGKIGARRIIGVSALRPLQIVAGPDAYVSQDFLNQDREAMEKQLDRAQENFFTALTGVVSDLEWRSSDADVSVSGYVASQMRAADLLITQPRPRDLRFESGRYMSVADVVLEAGRPVLVVGDNVSSLDLRSVMIAWNDSREARRAIDDAIPMLRLAHKITVVEVVDNGSGPGVETRMGDVAGWLKRHGIVAETRIEQGAGEAPAVLEAVARSLDAGLVVAGGYGHSRFREWVLGGVTRDYLLQPPRCTFISH
jgi:nucleotide-binding universal stress UspA family protein